MFMTYVLRVAVTLTFLILAAGGPYAIIQLRQFIRRYRTAHRELETRVEALERRGASQNQESKQ